MKFDSRIRRWLLRIVMGVLLLAAGSSLAVYGYGRFAERALGAPSSALAPQEEATALDRLIGPVLAQHPGESAMILVEDNLESYALRARSARQAERSLDVMYYIWRADQSGMALARELLAAADRGARVRLLLDDNSQRGQDDLLLALDAHPHLEVRLFNPGRNIGDEYFDGAEQVNFTDADLLLIGPASEQASVVFDRFWNSRAVIPVSALARDGAAEERELPHASAGQVNRAYDEALTAAVASIGQWLAAQPVHWSSKVQVLTDPPEKALLHGSQEALRSSLLIEPLLAALGRAQDSATLISPYFVPGEAGSHWLAELAGRIRQVRVLTNSLAATDVALVHAGYSAYRRPLLEAGIELRELAPDHHQKLAWLGSSSASLHTKAFVVDDVAGFVGSFNFDPRSTWLNTEMGVLFEHPGMAAQLRNHYERTLRPGASFGLFLEEGSLRWRDARTSPETIWNHDPDSNWLLRALLAVVRWLPIESQL